MAGVFTNPSLLSAFAIQVQGDPDLPDGVHLRVAPSADIGFPISPFIVWKVQTETTGRAKSAEKPDGGTQLVPPQDGRHTVGAALPNPVSSSEIAIVDRLRHRTVSRRFEEPMIVAAPTVERVRVTGGGGLIVYYTVSEAGVMEQMLWEKPVTWMPLPIKDRLSWYAGGIGRDEALQRVRRGAPQRMTPLDDPNGSFAPLTPDDEGFRVEVQADQIDRQLREMLRAADPPPWAAVLQDHRTANGNDPESAIEFAIASLLLIQSGDPGIARYLGLAELLPLTSDPLPAYAVCGLFVVDPKRIVGGVRLTQAVGDPHPNEDQLIANFMRDIPDLGPLIESYRANGLDVRALTCVAAAPPPPDAPTLLSAEAREQVWLDNDLPSTAFRQSFRFAEDDLSSMVAMSRLDWNTWIPCAEEIDVDQSQLMKRRVPMLLGRDRAGNAIQSATPVSADIGPRYRFHVSDVFGRFGEPIELGFDPPPRPLPPTPSPQIVVEKSAPDHQATTPQSPGLLRIKVPIPHLVDLPLGSLGVVRVDAMMDGELKSAAADGTGTPLNFSFVLRDLAPAKKCKVDVQVRFADSSNNHSEWSQDNLTVTDGRRPASKRAGPALIWTSTPGPAESVELKLRWSADAGVLYRAYIADAKGLGIDAATRAAIGVEGVSRQRQGQLNGNNFRQVFRLLSDAPIRAGSDNIAVLRETLPRALQSVQFVRIVPVTEDGVEADFNSCALVPVAVPSDRRPPPPLLSAETSADGRQVELKIAAPGLNRARIKASEPGLLTTPPAPNAKSPLMRLRRASGTLADPIYARNLITNMALTFDAPSNAFAASFTDGEITPLLPFVRYTYWAEVAYPAERRLPPNVTETAPPDGIEALHDAQMQDMPAPYSTPSTPVGIVAAPATAPAALAESQIKITGIATGPSVTLNVEVSGLPVAHAKAIAPWKLMVWRQWHLAATDLVMDEPVTAAALNWSEVAVMPRSPATISVVIVDPLGRRSPVTRKSWM